ncbi:hypothetical protein ACCO45_011099 [Purpureocillium lilacinum]|uniref:Uncharacterized protein n=1 Tax=Purpureocillium lilacinum TaxID=33203 RepID=A0ACC4DH48_PURLI
MSRSGGWGGMGEHDCLCACCRNDRRIVRDSQSRWRRTVRAGRCAWPRCVLRTLVVTGATYSADAVRAPGQSSLVCTIAVECVASTAHPYRPHKPSPARLLFALLERKSPSAAVVVAVSPKKEKDATDPAKVSARNSMAHIVLRPKGKWRRRPRPALLFIGKCRALGYCTRAPSQVGLQVPTGIPMQTSSRNLQRSTVADPLDKDPWQRPPASTAASGCSSRELIPGGSMAPWHQPQTSEPALRNHVLCAQAHDLFDGIRGSAEWRRRWACPHNAASTRTEWRFRMP